MTLIASHRGGSLEAPENSPTSFRHTAGLGVEQVEFDIHPTSDGHIVVIHDATLERTTDGVGSVAARSTGSAPIGTGWVRSGLSARARKSGRRMGERCMGMVVEV